MFDSNDALDALCTAMGRHGPSGWAVFDGAGGDPAHFTLCSDLDTLLGWTAPAGAWAVGLIADGTARSLDAGAPALDRCRVACVIDRSGATAARLDLADGARVHDAPEAGRALEVLRRTLGLHTEPPGQPVRRILTWLWLRSVATQVTASDRPLDGPEVLAVHPVMLLTRPIPAAAPLPDDGLTGLPGAPMASVVGDVASLWSWSDLRETLAMSAEGLGPVTPALAEWMDEGMLCRWLGDAVGDLDDVLSTVLDGVTDEAQSLILGLFLRGMAPDEEPDPDPTSPPRHGSPAARAGERRQGRRH